MPQYGIFATNSNTIETTVAKDSSAMMSIHFAQCMAMHFSDILNQQKGTWYVEQFLYFETPVWPKFIANGAMVDYLDVLKKQQNDLVVR